MVALLSLLLSIHEVRFCKIKRQRNLEVVISESQTHATASDMWKESGFNACTVF